MMITAVVSVVTYIPFTLLDSAGDPELLKVNGDFTKSAYLVSTTATTATATVTENASGTYRISFTPSVVGIWHVTWSVSVDGETVRFEEMVQVETAAQADPAAYIAAGDITMVSPVSATGAVTLYQGDTYDADETRSLDWSTTDAGTWPDLTGATIALIVQQKRTKELVTIAGSVVTPTGATKQVRVEVTAVQSLALEDGLSEYQLVATLTNTHVVTLAADDFTVTPRLT